jgi:hypothetical protein
MLSCNVQHVRWDPCAASKPVRCVRQASSSRRYPQAGRWVQHSGSVSRFLSHLQARVMLALLYLSYYQIKDMTPSWSLTRSFSFSKILHAVSESGCLSLFANPCRVGFDYISYPPGSGSEQTLGVLARAAQVAWIMINLSDNWATVR